MRRLRLELSLSSRSVTIGTAALAYLHDAACRGPVERERRWLPLVGTGGRGRREEHVAKGWWREGEREEQSVHGFGTSGMHLLHGSWPQVKTGRAHSGRNTGGKKEREEETRRGGGGGRSGENSLRPHQTCLLPVRRVFAYPRHDQDPICIAPMKLLPLRSFSCPPPPSVATRPQRGEMRGWGWEEAERNVFASSLSIDDGKMSRNRRFGDFWGRRREERRTDFPFFLFFLNYKAIFQRRGRRREILKDR